MFYEGSLQNGVTSDDRLIEESTFPWPVIDTPMMFWANYGREELSASGNSYLNRVEAMNVEKSLLNYLKMELNRNKLGLLHLMKVKELIWCNLCWSIQHCWINVINILM